MPAIAPPKPTGEAPFGSSPVTGPTPNKGFEAAALQRAGLVAKQLMDILQMAGPTSDIGRDVLKMLAIINKHVPAGSVSPASEKANIERMAMQNTQQNQQMQSLKQRQAQGGAEKPPGGAAPSPQSAQAAA